MDTIQFNRSTVRQVILAGSALAGLGMLMAFVIGFSQVTELDFHAYYFAGQKVITGDPFVGWAVTDGTFLVDKAFVYLPITAPAFVPYALLADWRVAFFIHSGLLLLSLCIIAYLTIEIIESHGVSITSRDRLIIIAACTVSVPAAVRFVQGNIDPILLLLLVIGLLAIERNHQIAGGAIWAVVALFKLFPAFLGIWLIYRRAYYAVAAAVLVGIGGIIASVASFGLEANIAFFEFVVTERSRSGAFDGPLDPTYLWITLRRPLSQVVTLSGHQLTMLATWLIVPFVLLVYWAADSRVDYLLAYFVTLIALLVTIVPSTVGYIVYLLFPLIALLYIVEQRVAWWSFVLGFTFVSIPVYPHHIERGLEATPLPPVVVEPVVAHGYQILTYGSIPLWGMLFIIVGCVSYTIIPHIQDAIRKERQHSILSTAIVQALTQLATQPKAILPFGGVVFMLGLLEIYDGWFLNTLSARGVTVGAHPATVYHNLHPLDAGLVTVFFIGILLVVVLTLVTLYAIATVYLLTDDSSLTYPQQIFSALKHIPTLFIATIIALIGGILGLIAFVIPGLVILTAYVMAGPAIVLENRGPVEGLLAGWREIRQNLLLTVGYVTITMGIIGLLVILSVLGIVFVGFILLPILAASAAQLYVRHNHGALPSPHINSFGD